MTLLNYFLFFLILGEFHYRLLKFLEGFVSSAQNIRETDAKFQNDSKQRRKIQEIQKKERQSLYVS